MKIKKFLSLSLIPVTLFGLTPLFINSCSTNKSNEERKPIFNKGTIVREENKSTISFTGENLDVIPKNEVIKAINLNDNREEQEDLDIFQGFKIISQNSNNLELELIDISKEEFPLGEYKFTFEKIKSEAYATLEGKPSFNDNVITHIDYDNENKELNITIYGGTDLNCVFSNVDKVKIVNNNGEIIKPIAITSGYDILFVTIHLDTNPSSGTSYEISLMDYPDVKTSIHFG